MIKKYKLKFKLVYASFIIACFLLSNTATAQVEAEITGQVKSKKEKQALEFCSVRVMSLSDSLIIGAITDAKGFFTLPLEKGKYKLLVGFVGYKTDTSFFNVNTKNKFIGIIELELDETDLAEIEINRKTRVLNINKEVVLVTKQMRVGTGKTSDVLDKMQGLSYDRYNNSIKVDGNSNIIILVNGLEKDQEYIKNLTPERLKEVEIIRNPSGRYALEGYTAVINVILKSNYKGTEFYIENEAIMDIDSKEDPFWIINGFSATYNYTYDKLNFYSKFSNHMNEFFLASTSEKEFANGYEIKNSLPLGKKNTLGKSINSNLTLGTDYYINPKHTISFESNIRAFPPASNLTTQKYDVKHFDNGIEVEQFRSDMENLSKPQSFSNSFFYIGKLNNRNKINADFSILNYTDEFTNKLSQSNGYSREEDGENKKYFSKLFLEWEHSFKNNSSLMVGYGNSWQKLENNFFSTTMLSTESTGIKDTVNFKLTDLRSKLYAYYSWKITKKVSIKTGMAVENSSPKINGIGRNYFIYQPHADISYRPIDIVTVKLKYRTRAHYPNISQATPFTHIIDQRTTEVGNPLLSPSLTHKLAVRISAMDGLFAIEPYYHRSNNYITRTISEANDGSIQFSYDNVGNYTNKGVKGNFTIPLFKQKVILQTNLNYYQKSIAYNENTFNLTDWNMEQKMLYIDKKYNTVLGLVYQKGMEKVINAQGYTSDDIDNWLLFVQQPFLKGKANVMLAYLLPINWGINHNQGNYTNTGTYTETAVNDIKFAQNVVVLRLSYRFSKGRTVKKIKKDIQQDNEGKAGGGIF